MSKRFNHHNVSYNLSLAEEKHIKQNRKKKELKDFESIQLSIQLSLLNKYCSFVLQKPEKQSKVTLPFVKVLSVIFEEEINVEQLAEQSSNYYLNKDKESGAKSNVLFRRFERNKKAFILNFLQDLLYLLGYSFVIKQSNCKCILAFDRISCIYHNKILIMNKDEMIWRGKIINSYLINQLDKNTTVSIKKNDSMIEKYLNCDIDFLKSFKQLKL
ncbi:TATA-binding protein-associated phosphoprotein [Entamoeba marina]